MVSWEVADWVLATDKTYENIVEEQPIGRRLFVRFCSRDEKLKNSIDFEAELEDFDKLLEEERSVAAQKIWDKFLSPQSQCRIEQISDEMADEVQSEISNDLSRNVFDNCRRYVWCSRHNHGIIWVFLILLEGFGNDTVYLYLQNYTNKLSKAYGALFIFCKLKGGRHVSIQFN
jgi:hypothetical protein